MENLTKDTNRRPDLDSEALNSDEEALRERISDEPDSIGVDIDGTNPGSRSHPLDEPSDKNE